MRSPLLFVLLLLPGSVRAQQMQTVVADAATHEPVAHASLYSRDSGRFRSAISGNDGVARITFPFQRLTVSHLNYERLTVSRIPDTLFLKPRYQQKAEVVITNREPEWIRRRLRQTIRQKEARYFSRPDSLLLSYHTQSIDARSIYRMHLSGRLRTMSTLHQLYALSADSIAITASDNTRLTDMMNLRRMLYEDFVMDLDNGFLRAHRFYHNADYRGASPHEVELRFRSKSGKPSRGWLVMDTVRCVVLSAYRFTGTEVNRSERIDGVMYALARVFGYRIDTFTRDYSVSYALRPDGTLYPREVRYKMYLAGRDGDDGKAQQQFNEQTGGGFPNIDGTLTLMPRAVGSLQSPPLVSPVSVGDSTVAASSPWYDLPRSWYVKYNTDADRQREVVLSNLPATFRLFAE